VVAIGGLGGLEPPETSTLTHLRYLLRLAGGRNPRVCLVNTAMGDDPASLPQHYERIEKAGAVPSHLALFPMPNVEDPADLLLSADVVFVGGGSVANQQAVWQVHGIGEILRRAWESGVVLSGVSAGAICWFHGGTTDSFGPRLRPFTGGLGLLPGSYCPHYDGEDQRRPLYTGLVARGVLPAGIACDDGAGAHFIDGELDAVVTDRPDVGGYRVEPDGAGGFIETALPSRRLPAP
jgi:peptidase E